jgi:hypothetical protein
MLLNNTAFALYNYEYHGVNCETIIDSEYNLNKCMSTNLANDVSPMPNNCEALTRLYLNRHTTAITLANIQDGTEINANDLWIPLCNKFNNDCDTITGLTNTLTTLYDTCTTTSTYATKTGCLALYDY